MSQNLDFLFKIPRGPKLEGCAFANFGNSSGTEEEPSQKREKNGRKKKKKINAATTRNRTRDLSITDRMSVLTNQVHLKIQFRHIFDQKCPFNNSLHRLGSRFARIASVPLETKSVTLALSTVYNKENRSSVSGCIFPAAFCQQPTTKKGYVDKTN